MRAKEFMQPVVLPKLAGKGTGNQSAIGSVARKHPPLPIPLNQEKRRNCK
jgi:hypothetical protein